MVAEAVSEGDTVVVVVPVTDDVTEPDAVYDGDAVMVAVTLIDGDIVTVEVMVGDAVAVGMIDTGISNSHTCPRFVCDVDKKHDDSVGTLGFPEPVTLNVTPSWFALFSTHGTNTHTHRSSAL